MRYNCIVPICLGILCLALITPTAAEFLVEGDNVICFKVQAQNNDGDSAELCYYFTPGRVSGHYKKSLPGEQDLTADKGHKGKHLGKLKSLDLDFETDPRVSLGFSVEAADVDTAFTITSALVPFSAITNPLAYASAGVTLTGDGDGAQLTGLFAGGKAYEARYNTDSTPVVWAQLVGPVTAPPNTTVVSPDRRPGAGYELIPATVSSIQSEFKFLLSANDLASGTSRFEVLVPEPGCFALAAVGAVCLAGLACRRLFAAQALRRNRAPADGREQQS